MKKLKAKNQRWQSRLDWLSGWKEIAAIVMLIAAALVAARIYYSL